MDVISYQKAQKAKRNIKETQDRLGLNGTEQEQDIVDIYNNVDDRITELEKKDPGIELFNRVSDVSAHTLINLNKHNLRVSSLLNQSRYNLSDMVVDDFTDDSGIDKDISTNYLYDSTNTLIKVAEGESESEIITIAEDLETDPQMVVVSQATIKDGEVLNDFLEVNKYNDLEEGTIYETVINPKKYYQKIIAIHQSN